MTEIIIDVAIISAIPIESERESFLLSRYEAMGRSKKDRSTAKEKGIKMPRATCMK